MKLDIAVIIPVHNRTVLLRRALDSVMAQSIKPAEICVVDDGSDKSVVDVLGRDYPLVKFLRQKNLGVSAARNAGVAATSSPWLAFLDSDDEWLPDKLARQVEQLNVNPDFNLVHCDEIWIRNGRRVNPMKKHSKSGGDIFTRCLSRCVISPSAVLMRRKLFTELDGFDEALPACEDYDLWLRICCSHPVLFVDEPLLKKYGGHSDQLSRQYWGMDRFRVQALVKLLESGQINSRQAQLARAMLIEKSHILAMGARKRGNTSRAQYFYNLEKRYAS